MSADRTAAAPARPAEARVPGRVDATMIGAMRCLLALIAMGATYLDPLQARSLEALYAVVLAYAAFALILFAPGLRSHRLRRAEPWIDVAFYVALVMLTDGPGSIFFHFFFFAILVAAFSRGFREGFAVTLVPVLALIAMGVADHAAGSPQDVIAGMSEAVSLYLIGYMIAYWGGHEIAQRRRLSLLRELSAGASGGAGVDKSIELHLARLTSFFGAGSALLVFSKAGDPSRLLYRAGFPGPFAVLPPGCDGGDLARLLLDLPPGLSVSVDARRSWLPWRSPQVLAWEGGAPRTDPAASKRCLELANLLEAPAFASVPYRHGAISGRLYLTAARGAFGQAETQFLALVAGQMASAVSNVMLAQALTSEAARSERSRISRDIHDTTVQSYIGLKLGLEALYRDIDPAAPAAHRIKELLDMASLTVDDLRGYVDRLRSQRRPPDAQLLGLIEEQRRRYRDYHDIEVEVRAGGPLEIDGAAADEAYRVVCEGLSNVFRHTAARRAFVDLCCRDGLLAIEVGNEAPSGAATPAFLPRSIAERARSLGGTVEVGLNRGGHDLVRVVIPATAERRLEEAAP